MAFVNERYVDGTFTDQDREFLKSYHFSLPEVIDDRCVVEDVSTLYSWTADRDREMYLVILGGDGSEYDGRYRPSYAKFIVENQIVDIEGIRKSWRIGPLREESAWTLRIGDTSHLTYKGDIEARMIEAYEAFENRSARRNKNEETTFQIIYDKNLRSKSSVKEIQGNSQKRGRVLGKKSTFVEEDMADGSFTEEDRAFIGSSVSGYQLQGWGAQNALDISSWIADRERGIYLIGLGGCGDRSPDLGPPSRFKLIIGRNTVTIDARYIGSGCNGIGITEAYRLRVAIPRDIEYKGDVVALVEEAFDAMICGKYWNIISIKYEYPEKLQ